MHDIILFISYLVMKMIVNPQYPEYPVEAPEPIIQRLLDEVIELDITEQDEVEWGI